MRHPKLIFLCSILLLFSCKKEPIVIVADDYHALVDHLTEVMIHDIFSPPVASRIYAYPNIAAYQTLNGHNGVYKSLGNQLNDLQETPKPQLKKQINKELAALIAYLDVAKELVFSKDKIEVYRDSLYTAWKDINEVDFTNAKVYGLSVSKEIISWMSRDKYKETRTMPDFTVIVTEPGRWQPTPPAYMKGIEPNWNKIRPFVLDSAAQFKPIPPPKFSLEEGTDFYKELMEVYTITNDIKQKGNESEEIKIAQFWDCNPYVAVNKGHFMFASKKITPGAHWIGICKIASKQTNSDFNTTVFAYTKTSIAIVDAFISCWDENIEVI